VVGAGSRGHAKRLWLTGGYRADPSAASVHLAWDRRGHVVARIYARRGLYVTALGVAQEDGALGDLVRVMNAASRRQLQGVLSGPDEVAFGSAAAWPGRTPP
jgi:flagellar basal body P-ring formation protein FlgA